MAGIDQNIEFKALNIAVMTVRIRTEETDKSGALLVKVCLQLVITSRLKPLFAMNKPR